MNKYKQTKLGPECDVALSSRVRIARNFSGIPFSGKMTGNDRDKVVNIVRDALNGKDEYQFMNVDNESQANLNSLMENRIISSDFIRAPKGRGLIINENAGVFVMVNEEDHLRIQSITSGFSLDEAYENVEVFDNLIDEKLDYAFNEKLGYLTYCPTNLGTGMRASVMLHLPVLRMNKIMGQIIKDLAKIGLTIRGLYGENTEAAGDLYQISNQVTLGITETETIQKLKSTITKLIAMERAARGELLKNSNDIIKDKIMRSYGIFTNANIININEFFTLYTDIRLGVTYGFIKDFDYKTLDLLLTDVMPANIRLGCGGGDTQGYNLDIYRAEKIKETMRRDF